MITNEAKVGYLNYLTKTYDGITQLIASTKQRLQSLPGEEINADFDSMLKGENKVDGLETIKGRLVREMDKEIEAWEIWTRWMKNIPGIGPALAGRLIIYYYYRFVPICPKCGGDLEKIAKQDNGTDEKRAGKMVCKKCGNAAKEGLLKYRMEVKDFPNISKWWKYMGRHTVDGMMPKLKKGVFSDWGTPKRTLGFHIGDQFNRQEDDHPYKAFMLTRKKRHEARNEKWTLGHRHNAARNEAVKLFLSHFWQVARTLDGLPVTEPYAGAIMGHTGIVKPFYWDSHYPSHYIFETQPKKASHCPCETQLMPAPRKRGRPKKVVAAEV
jgi:hypothetical protein